MAKKMTAKKFWEVLEGAGYDKEIWGYEGILNIISIHETQKEREALKVGFDAAASESRRRADYIYDALDELDFYKA